MNEVHRYNSELPAVLVLAFNRPDLTAQIVDRARMAGVTRLYVACDGPRPGRVDDQRNVRAIQERIDSIDWCDAKTFFREQNQGCGPGVSQGISWFLNETEEGIILEDDCLPHPSFFHFCGELLDRYRQTTNVMQIAGYNFLGGKYPCEYDYLFSHFGWQWGWATWKRAWDHFDLRMTSWPLFKHHGLHRAMPFYAERNETFDHTHAGGVSSWAYPWHYCMAIHSGISVVPAFSLIENIGFGAAATHGTDPREAVRYAVGIKEMRFPMRHFPFLIADPKYDKRLIHAVHKRGSVKMQALRMASRLRKVLRGHRR